MTVPDENDDLTMNTYITNIDPYLGFTIVYLNGMTRAINNRTLMVNLINTGIRTKKAQRNYNTVLTRSLTTSIMHMLTICPSLTTSSRTKKDNRRSSLQVIRILILEIAKTLQRGGLYLNRMITSRPDRNISLISDNTNGNGGIVVLYQVIYITIYTIYGRQYTRLAKCSRDLRFLMDQIGATIRTRLSRTLTTYSLHIGSLLYTLDEYKRQLLTRSMLTTLSDLGTMFLINKISKGSGSDIGFQVISRDSQIHSRASNQVQHGGFLNVDLISIEGYDGNDTISLIRRTRRVLNTRETCASGAGFRRDSCSFLWWSELRGRVVVA